VDILISDVHYYCCSVRGWH